MKIAAVQLNCHLNEPARNRRRALQLIESAQADLYVLPELFASGYLFSSREQVWAMAESIPDGETCRQLGETAHKRACHIVAGLAEKAGTCVYNTSVLIGPRGVVAYYRKIHLFSEEKQWFDPGDKPFAVHDIGSCKLGMMICFDWLFPESMRSLTLQGAQVICHSANLVLPFCQQAMTTRCLENSVFAVTANRVGLDRQADKKLRFTGRSQITGTRGEILAQAGKLQEEVIVAEINPKRADEKWLNPANHLLQDRRPSLYTL
jgi:predicted amidohydrolase